MRIKTRMARPRTGRNGSSTNLYLNDELKGEAKKVARSGKLKESLSDVVERGLRIVIQRHKRHAARLVKAQQARAGGKAA